MGIDTPRKQKWWPRLLGFEPPDWPQRRARLAILRMVPEVSRPVAVLLLGLAILEGSIKVAIQFASGAVVGAIPGAISLGSGSSASRALFWSIGILGLLFVVSNLVPIVRTRFAVWMSEKVNHLLRLRLMDSMVAPVGVTHLEDPEIRDEVARAGGLGLFAPGAAVEGMTGLLVNRVASFGSFVVVASFRWWLAVALMIFALAHEAKARTLYMETARIVYRQTKDLRKSDYFRSLTLGGSPKELRVFGMLDWMVDRFTNHWLDAMKEVWRDRAGAQRHMFWSTPLLIISHGAAFAIVGSAAVTGEIDIARFTVLVGAIFGIRSFISYGLDRTKTEYGATAYIPILELDEKIAAHGFVKEGTVDPANMPADGIKIENLRFRYPGREDYVFDGLNLQIPAGRSLAIVGANGAGKTTLCKLLARCYEPNEGRIIVDGINLHELDPRAWQRRISAIFQDYVGFLLPAKDNVGFGAVERLHEEDALRGAARRAGAEELIDGLPNGWSTILSKWFESGTELSGGEWQRVALARALFAVDAGAGLLVLDEPTAALDVRLEAQLFDRYLELTRGVTSILVSHRFSTVRHADRICVLHEGAVVEGGTHDELMALKGRYAEMFNLQAARFVEEEVVP